MRTDKAVDRTNSTERQTRVDAMIEEFRVARQRRLVKREIAVRNPPEHAPTMACVEPPPPGSPVDRIKGVAGVPAHEFVCSDCQKPFEVTGTISEGCATDLKCPVCVCHLEQKT